MTSFKHELIKLWQEFCQQVEEYNSPIHANDPVELSFNNFMYWLATGQLS